MSGTRLFGFPPFRAATTRIWGSNRHCLQARVQPARSIAARFGGHRRCPATSLYILAQPNFLARNDYVCRVAGRPYHEIKCACFSTWVHSRDKNHTSCRRHRLQFWPFAGSAGCLGVSVTRVPAMVLNQMAPRAGFEPATNRLTAGCSTTELPRNSALNWPYSKAFNILPSPIA